MSVNFQKLVLVILFLSGIESINAQIEFPSFISDNMVLQQQTEASIWGWAEKGIKVKIKCSWDNSEYSVVAKKKRSGNIYYLIKFIFSFTNITMIFFIST